ncbi:MAG: hypothetical protein PVJ92_02685, partial [Candidatus Dependentiae bacterium]
MKKNTSLLPYFAAFSVLLGAMPLQAMSDSEGCLSTAAGSGDTDPTIAIPSDNRSFFATRHRRLRTHSQGMANWQRLALIAAAMVGANLAMHGKKSSTYHSLKNIKDLAKWLWRGSKEGRLHDAKAHVGRNKKKYLVALLTLLATRAAKRRSYKTFADPSFNEDLAGALRSKGPMVLTKYQLVKSWNVEEKAAEYLAGKNMRLDSNGNIEAQKSWSEFVAPVRDYLGRRGTGVTGALFREEDCSFSNSDEQDPSHGDSSNDPSAVDRELPFSASQVTDQTGKAGEIRSDVPSSYYDPEQGGAPKELRPDVPRSYYDLEQGG